MAASSSSGGFQPSGTRVCPCFWCQGQQEKERERIKILQERGWWREGGETSWGEGMEGAGQPIRSQQEGESDGADATQGIHAERMGMTREEKQGQGRQKILPVSAGARMGMVLDGL